MDEHQQTFQYTKTDGCSPGKKRTGWRKNSKTRKPFQAESDKNQEQENSGTLELEHVLGLTVFSNSALTSDPMNGLVAYPAGCVLVLLDCVKYKQLGTLHTPRRSITAAKFSPDGRYVLTGESGLHPAVRVWELSSMTEVATLRGHSVGIISVSFSPRMREIIVVGDAQDMMISVWAWPSKIMKTLNKFADEIYAMAVAEDSSFFTTVGNRHVKFYYLDNMRTLPAHINNTCPIPLPTRCGILDNLKENCFCDVVCGRGCSSLYIFVVAMSGILCQINRDRYLERWVHVNMAKAYCLTADENCIFVGGTQGVVRMFRALDLQIITTLPRPHILGLDISQVTTSYIEDFSEDMSMSTLEENLKDKESPQQYPTTRAISYDSCHEILTVVYGDRSIYIWGRTKPDLNNSELYYFNKKYSSMYHRGCIWGLTTYPAVLDSDPEEAALGGALPPGALISVSADGTLRAWDVCANICEESMLKRNCLSAECLKIVYADKIETTRKLRLHTKPREGSFVRHGKHSFSAVTVCPDGFHIATGNQHGRVCIYDTNTMNVMTTMLAHEAEVTALGYSITKRYKVLASGSRDRMIHVMDASHGYQLLTTLDDHSSTITAINFTYIARCILMVTSSLDMSVLIRAYLDSSVFSFKPVRAIVEKKSVVDFAINQWSGLIAMACQDRLVRVYSIISSVESTTFRGCPSHGGQLVKIEVDPSGQYLLTACSNRTINLLQFNTGYIMNTFYGHAESITSIKFSHNMKHIITSAIDGCIFLWRLPESVTYSVKREMAEMGKLTRGMVLGERWKKSRLVSGVLPLDVRSEPEFRSMPESTPDLKVDLSLYNIQDQKYKTRSGESRFMAKSRSEENRFMAKVPTFSTPHEADSIESKDCIVLKKVADISSTIWTTPELSSIAIGPTTDDMTNKLRGKRGQNNKQLNSLMNNHISSTTLSPTSEAWLSACYERRRIFKLEARSIKKILAMMRLVTDAMEKDLAGNNWLMYSSPEVSSRRMGLMMPTTLRPLQQPPLEQAMQQLPHSNIIHQSLPSVIELSLPVGQDSSTSQPSTLWKSELRSGDCVCKLSEQLKKSDHSLLKLHKKPSLLNIWQDQNQSQKLPENWVPAACENGSGHYGDIKQMFSCQRLQSGRNYLKEMRAQQHSRIPVWNGSGLSKSNSRCSKVLAVETPAESSIHECTDESFGYLNHTSKGHERELNSSLNMQSSCSDTSFLESSLHNKKENEADQNGCIDNTYVHDNSDTKKVLFCTSKEDSNFDTNTASESISKGGFFQPAAKMEDINNFSNSICCSKGDIDNMDFITTTSDYAICGNSSAVYVPGNDCEDNAKESKTTVENKNSFEDFFNSVAMFETLSDELPSICDLVDNDADPVLEEISNNKTCEYTDIGTCLNCIIHEQSTAEFNQFTRAHCCSSVEVLCGAGGVLLENKDRCAGGGDGVNASDPHNKILCNSYSHHSTNFCPKSLIYKVESAGQVIMDNTTKIPSLIILDKVNATE